MSPGALDVLCLGRAGVDLYAEQIGVPLEDVTSFAKYMGGCPGNISVGTSRLGLKSGMLTRVGNDGLGRFVRGFLEKEGVDVSTVGFDPSHLTGLAILGIQPPDKFPLLFYRVDCADLQITVEDVDRARLERTKAILVSGTGLSHEPSRSATFHAISQAKALGVKVILDVDVRTMLWKGGNAELASQLKLAIPAADLVVGTEEEISVAAGGTDGERGIEAVRAMGQALVVVKRGPRGATAYPHLGRALSHPGFSVKVLNTLGAGDGFMSGFLRGWLSGWSLEDSLKLANAVGAILVTRHGCAPAMPTFPEAQAFIEEAKAA